MILLIIVAGWLVSRLVGYDSSKWLDGWLVGHFRLQWIPGMGGRIGTLEGDQRV